MHLEVKVALNFIVSYLYNKLPRRRADLFGEELERILVSRFKGHWYPESPSRGSGFRCLHLGTARDPVIDLAVRRSGLDANEVHANVPPELSVWIDPYEVSYQIGEKGEVNVLYVEDSPNFALAEEEPFGEVNSLGFNPEAQVFVPIGGQTSQSLPGSPTPLSTSSHLGMFGYSVPSTPTNSSAGPSNTSTPTTAGLVYPQPIASFAATKFGSTKMRKSVTSTGPGTVQHQRMMTLSPITGSLPGLAKNRTLSLSMNSLDGSISSQLSPDAKEFVFPSPQRLSYFDAEAPAMATYQAPPPHVSFNVFSGPASGQVMGIMAGSGKSAFVEGFGGYNLQYSGQIFQSVVMAN